MFCPVCKGEFRDGFKKCDGCGVGLVRDLDNLPDYIEGEFLYCPNCDIKFDNNVTDCPECGMKLVRALESLSTGERVLLDDVDFSTVKQGSSDNFNTSVYEHCKDLKREHTEILLETEDMEFMSALMEILDKEEIDFDYVPPEAQTEDNGLGSIFGVGSPLARNFPRVVVKAEDLDRATALLERNESLGLFDVPEELMGGDDEEEEEDDE